MYPDDVLYQIALTLVPHIGDVHAKTLINRYGDARSVFRAKKSDLEYTEGIGPARAHAIKSFSDFKSCEAEMRFMEKFRITPLFITHKKYPQRLLHCYDSPLLLYYCGNADLNASRIVSVVGTRSNSGYGKMVCEKLVEDLRAEHILVVSGLALGIDTIAHKTALKQGMPTVGVVAHGLDRVYPAQNKALARSMTEQGGLLTDFRSNTDPDKQNFPRRNRIVAGMCDALVVIESGAKGGSLITAELANGYNKDVFAIPGRVNDTRSEGCHSLIRSNKASLITGAADLMELMGWQQRQTVPERQRKLFIELTPEEKLVTDILQQHGQLHVDELYFKSGLAGSAAAAALLALEMQQVVTCLPGKMYKLN